MTVPGWLQAGVDRAGRAEPGVAGRLVRGLLTLAAAVYGAAMAARNAGYDAGLLPVHRLPCRVMCVGNLTVGGTGKTPTVLALADALVRAGAKPCILLRGYGGAGAGARVVSDGREVLLDWRAAGDEAVLLARRAPGVAVIVGADRVRAGGLAVERFSPDIALLDDGFQHRRLHRDVDLVLLDAADPFGGERLLPHGRLREGIGALRRAHAILVTRADPAADRRRLREALRAVAGPVPLGWSRHRPLSLLPLGGGAETPLEALRGRRLFAVSGIAAPGSFLQTLEWLRAHIVGARAFPDHHPFTGDDRAEVSRLAAAAGAEWIVTTEKDAVRLMDGETLALPTFALRIALEVFEGAEALEPVLGVRLAEVPRG